MQNTPLLAADLTELPGLDDLSCPTGVLASLQTRIAMLWHSRRSFISTNGASAALQAAVMVAACSGQKILLPRNVHRSALHAIVMSGAEPVFYESDWLENWGTWASAQACQIEKSIAEHKNSLHALLVVSPNYAGCISDLEKIRAIATRENLLLIVDEAHGGHFFAGTGFPESALCKNADLVVHSLHKTLSAPTQTGLIHIGQNCTLNDETIFSALQALQSSSPSYLLMLGIEKAIDELEAGDAPAKARQLADSLRTYLGSQENLLLLNAPNLDPLHILFRHKDLSAGELYMQLSRKGVFAETVLGDGLLLLLGLGSSSEDVELLKQVLQKLKLPEKSKPNLAKNIQPPPACKQVLNPRKAFFSKCEVVPTQEAVGRICADWLAPCPPGYALLSPGQLIEKESIKFIESYKSIRVVQNTSLEGDSDGSNSAS